MESDMDRWIQDRDRLSKQLEKCQIKYDNATVLQKVPPLYTKSIISWVIADLSFSKVIKIENLKKHPNFILKNMWNKQNIFSLIYNY